MGPRVVRTFVNHLPGSSRWARREEVKEEGTSKEGKGVREGGGGGGTTNRVDGRSTVTQWEIGTRSHTGGPPNPLSVTTKGGEIVPKGRTFT